MRAIRGFWVAALAGIVLAGCGSSSGVSDAKLSSALDLKTVAGKQTIGGNPFCSISKLLHDSGEVSDADDASQGRVLASKDGSVGIQVVTPFAPKCAKEAQAALDKLSKQE